MITPRGLCRLCVFDLRWCWPIAEHEHVPEIGGLRRWAVTLLKKALKGAERSGTLNAHADITCRVHSAMTGTRKASS